MLSLVLTCVAASGDEFVTEKLVPFLERHCVGCHAGDDAQADVDFARYESIDDVRSAPETWELARELLHFGDMPPSDRARPNADEQNAIIEWIGATFELEDFPAEERGRVTMRRLNRVEYRNTVFDLCGVDYAADDNFPTDGVGHGFDNLGDVLTMPNILLEKYLAAAETIAGQAVVVADPDNPPSVLVEAEQLETSRDFPVRGGARSMYTSGTVGSAIKIDKSGEYLVRIRATAQQAGSQPARMELRVDGKKKKRFDVDVEVPELGTYERKVKLEAGEHRFDARFTNDYYKPDHPNPKRRDRNLYVASIEVAGPVGDFRPSSFQGSLKKLAPDAFDAVRMLAQRAFRRPPTSAEVQRLVDLAGRKATWEETLQTALTALLVSPHFLFRVEPTSENEARALTDWELASRLSYFLWSSMPDEQLFELAEERKLRPNLQREVTRMLRDPRASSLAENFAAQWLKFRNLDEANPDPERFPHFDAELRKAMRRETELLFETVLREGRPVRELLAADYTFVNEKLAEHYGIEGVTGSHMRRVRIPA